MATTALWLQRGAVLAAALSIAALLTLAVGCGTEASVEVDTAPSDEATTDAAPEIGNRVGNLAPDFSVQTTSGVTRSLTDYTQANQPVVLYFFASW